MLFSRKWSLYNWREFQKGSVQKYVINYIFIFMNTGVSELDEIGREMDWNLIACFKLQQNDCTVVGFFFVSILLLFKQRVSYQIPNGLSVLFLLSKSRIDLLYKILFCLMKNQVRSVITLARSFLFLLIIFIVNIFESWRPSRLYTRFFVNPGRFMVTTNQLWCEKAGFALGF